MSLVAIMGAHDLFLEITQYIRIKDFRSLRRACPGLRFLPYTDYRRKRYECVDPQGRINPAARRYEFERMMGRKIEKMESGSFIELLDLLEEGGEFITSASGHSKAQTFWYFLRRCAAIKVYEVFWEEGRGEVEFILLGTRVVLHGKSLYVYCGIENKMIEADAWVARYSGTDDANMRRLLGILM